MPSKPAEDIHTDKRAQREKPWIFPAVLLLCVLFFASGAALLFFIYAPLRFSDAQVDRYVKNVYGQEWTLQKKNADVSREGGCTRFLYAKENGGSFSVFTFSAPLYRDGVPTGRFRRQLFDNYFSTVIQNNLKELKELGKKAHKKDRGLELEIEDTGTGSGEYGALYTFRLYLKKSSDLAKAAELIADMDSLLAFSRCPVPESGEAAADYGLQRQPVPTVSVYLKPDKKDAKENAADAVTSAAGSSSMTDKAQSSPVEETDWRDSSVRDAYEISRIAFTDSASSTRLSAKGVAARLENDYVDAAKTFGRTFYYIPEELWNKYPAPVLTLINISGNDLSTIPSGEPAPLTQPSGLSAAPLEEESHLEESLLEESAAEQTEENRIFTYHFVYHRKTGTYWMTGLDPCEDFDGNPFGDYLRRGSFANLVRSLGGSYMADRSSATWRIGSSEWTAYVDTEKTHESRYTYRRIHLTRDGNVTNLDSVPELFRGTGGTPSDRPYSIRDLIRMLDVRITINQREMTAVMFRDEAR